MFFASLSFLSLALCASAASTPKVTDCNISRATMNLPAGQTALVPPSEGPSYIGLAIGVQNYTCTASTSAYTNVGAVAELFDASCLYGTFLYSPVQDELYELWKNAPKSVTAQEIISSLSGISTPVVLGQHYYITNPLTGSGVSPKWDFTSSGPTKGNPNAFVVAAKVASISSPQGNATNIDWVSLKQVEGELASQVFRVDTIGGQPPTKCKPGSPDVSIKYSATYFLYGGSIKK